LKIPFVSLHKLNSELKSGFLSKMEAILEKGDFITGSELKTFENDYAAYSETTYCIGVNNGLDALKVALKAGGIGKADEVIVPANTFIATWLAVTEAGATPVPVDADETGNINVALIEAAITSKTKAIIPVHLYGLPCNMDEVMSIAAKHNLLVVEDNAQAQGALHNGKKTGSIGHINATSFYPSKNLGAAGDAGAITTNNVELYNKAMLLRSYGSSVKYIHEIAGYNTRMDTIQAAFLNSKLSKLDEHNDWRIRMAELYSRELAGIHAITLPAETPANYRQIYHLYTIRTSQRDKLRNYLQQQGIETGIHYPVPPHLQQAYKHLGYTKGDFSVTEEICETALSLPMYYGLTEEEATYVCDKVKGFFL
jgi:dTDP-4-amino-4,6-dideoxygalactose transaminase